MLVREGSQKLGKVGSAKNTKSKDTGKRKFGPEANNQLEGSSEEVQVRQTEMMKHARARVRAQQDSGAQRVGSQSRGNESNKHMAPSVRGCNRATHISTLYSDRCPRWVLKDVTVRGSK